jgi:GT2 family glycosyltransferase
MISIVIPFLNHFDLVHARMSDLYKFVPYQIEIVLVNDGSTDDGIDGGVAFWQKNVARHNIRYIKNAENHGFGYSMNKGADRATGDVLILLSNDVIIHKNFIDDVLLLLDCNPKSIIGGEFLGYDTGWNTFNGRTFPYLNGWMLAMHKSSWIDIGGFDLRYGISDYEDIHFCTEAIQKGYQLLPIKSGLLTHMGHQTAEYGPEREARTNRNKQLFKEKWIGK